MGIDRQLVYPGLGSFGCRPSYFYPNAHEALGYDQSKVDRISLADR